MLKVLEISTLFGNMVTSESLLILFKISTPLNGVVFRILNTLEVLDIHVVWKLGDIKVSVYLLQNFKHLSM